MNLDFHHNIAATVAIEPQTTQGASSTLSSGPLSLATLGAPSAVEVLCQVGELDSGGSFSFQLNEGELSSGADQAPPASGSILGTNPLVLSTQNTIGSIGYVGNAPYIEIVATAIQGGSTSIVSSTIIYGYTRKPPTQTP
jgi:hypothetical protein